MKSTEKSKLTLQSLIQKFIAFGYELRYQDGNRFIELYKSFANSNMKVTEGDELQIGRSIELCNGEIMSKPFMKRGYLWSGSAVTLENKGNVYTYGNERMIGTY